MGFAKLSESPALSINPHYKGKNVGSYVRSNIATGVYDVETRDYRLLWIFNAGKVPNLT